MNHPIKAQCHGFLSVKALISCMRRWQENQQSPLKYVSWSLCFQNFGTCFSAILWIYHELHLAFLLPVVII